MLTAFYLCVLSTSFLVAIYLLSIPPLFQCSSMRAESVFCSWCYSKGLKLELAYGKQALNSCSINEWMVLLKRKPRLRKVKGFPPKAEENETNPKHSDSILYTKPHHVPWWPRCWTHVSSLRLRDFCSIGQMAPEVPPVLKFCVALLGIYFDEGIMGALKKKTGLGNPWTSPLV